MKQIRKQNKWNIYKLSMDICSIFEEHISVKEQYDRRSNPNRLIIIYVILRMFPRRFLWGYINIVISKETKMIRSFFWKGTCWINNSGIIDIFLNFNFVYVSVVNLNLPLSLLLYFVYYSNVHSTGFFCLSCCSF